VLPTNKVVFGKFFFDEIEIEKAKIEIEKA
jgi:hypothetical protein